MAKVVQMTSVHVPFDTRIFHKECRTLADAGHEVVLLAHHDRNETVDGIEVRPLPPRNSRRSRMLLSTIDVYRAARREKADVYHFHDPELLPAGWLLSRRGARVICDSHEDLPRQLLSKEWVPPRLRPAVARLAGMAEAVMVRPLTAVVSAEPAGLQRFKHPNVALVQNWPKLEEFAGCGAPYEGRGPIVYYVGNITRHRGVLEMVDAVNLLPVDVPGRLELAGPFAPPQLLEEVLERDVQHRVTTLGLQSREAVVAGLNRARAGLVVLHPTPQYRNRTQPVKLFEYMAARVPFIASDFPWWKELAGTSNSGLFVDPLDPSAIAEAVRWILEHEEEAAAMGQRGRAHVEEKLSWHAEGRRLLQLYEQLLSDQ